MLLDAVNVRTVSKGPQNVRDKFNVHVVAPALTVLSMDVCRDR